MSKPLDPRPHDELTSFSEMLASETTTVGRQCDLARAFSRMGDGMATEVKMALADSLYSAASIARTLQRLGHDISEGSVRRCRRTCKCWHTNDE